MFELDNQSAFFDLCYYIRQDIFRGFYYNLSYIPFSKYNIGIAKHFNLGISRDYSFLEDYFFSSYQRFATAK